jgi:hypothetical protein
LRDPKGECKEFLELQAGRGSAHGEFYELDEPPKLEQIPPRYHLLLTKIVVQGLETRSAPVSHST